ncbi:hypothetical protein [Pseudomonas veronii]
MNDKSNITVSDAPELMEDIIAAIRDGNVVEMTFEAGIGTVSGGKLLEAHLPSGEVTVIEERANPGRMISDLPRF